MMPASPKKREEIRDRILDSASRLFNRRGFAAVSIDEVMGDAGLTRGSFYRYFSSKTELYAQSVVHAAGVRAEDRYGSESQLSADQIVREYLSVEHYEDIEGGCPMIALPSDISRMDRSIRTAFESALRLMVDIIEEDLGKSVTQTRDRAFAISALCVGGMVLARSVDDRRLAEELRQAALNAALSLGNWG